MSCTLMVAFKTQTWLTTPQSPGLALSAGFGMVYSLCTFYYDIKKRNLNNPEIVHKI